MAGDKAISMLPQRELLTLTGYVHGGCSPIGMRRAFPHHSATQMLTLFCSTGRIGYQIELSPQALMRACPASFADLALEGEI